MYEVNKNNAKYYYTRSANKQKEASSTGEAIYKRLHDNPDSHDIHTGDALNVVLDELTNPSIYAQVIGSSTRPIAIRSRQEHPVRVRRQHDRDQPGRLQRAGRSRLPADHSGLRARSRDDQGAGRQGPEADRERRTGLGRDAGELPRGHQGSESQGRQPPAADAPNRLEADNYLKALIGLSKMLETPSVAQYLTGLNKVQSTTLGHLISFMHTFNLRFGVAKTPEQEQAYDQLYPLLVAVRDQAKAPSANPYTTSSGPQDPKAVSNYFSGMQYDPKHGVVPPPPPRPRSLDERQQAAAREIVGGSRRNDRVAGADV